jgi:predicted ATPase
LIVTVEKNRANIIDVGYGVSQVLPILVETVFNREAGMFLFQQPEVHLHPKGQAELGSFFVDFASTKNKYVMIETHSDYIIDRIRSEIVRRKLDPDKFLSLLYFDRDDLETWISKIRVGEEGQIQNPPEKYRKFFLDESLRVMGLDQ